MVQYEKTWQRDYRTNVLLYALVNSNFKCNKNQLATTTFSRIFPSMAPPGPRIYQFVRISGTPKSNYCLNCILYVKAYRIINLQWIYMKGIIYRKWSWNDFRLIVMNIRSKKWISGLDNFRHLGSACFFANSFDVNPLIRNWISDPFKSSDFFW